MDIVTRAAWLPHGFTGESFDVSRIRLVLSFKRPTALRLAKPELRSTTARRSGRSWASASGSPRRPETNAGAHGGHVVAWTGGPVKSWFDRLVAMPKGDLYTWACLACLVLFGEMRHVTNEGDGRIRTVRGASSVGQDIEKILQPRSCSHGAFTTTRRASRRSFPTEAERTMHRRLHGVAKCRLQYSVRGRPSQPSES